MPTECLHRVTGAQDAVQERPSRVSCAVIAALLALSGCSMPTSMNPVDWWHDLEGGPIAEARPPPPNADAPYPNLASVPARPKTEATTQRTIVAAGLLVDRANAKYTETTQPLTVAPATPPKPAAAAPADQSGAVGGTLQAAAAPRRRPHPACASAGARRLAAAPMPPIPAAAPPPPVLTGAGVPMLTRPTPPVLAPPVTPPSTTAPSGTAVTVPFPTGSAELPNAARLALRQLAARRGAALIAVTGYGDAASSDPPDQSAAMPLAWARAQTIAGALRASGVPAGMLRLTAEATGDGGVAVVSD